MSSRHCNVPLVKVIDPAAVHTGSATPFAYRITVYDTVAPLEMVTCDHDNVMALPVSRTEIVGATEGEKVAPTKLFVAVAYFA